MMPKIDLIGESIEALFSSTRIKNSLSGANDPQRVCERTLGPTAFQRSNRQNPLRQQLAESQSRGDARAARMGLTTSYSPGHRPRSIKIRDRTTRSLRWNPFLLTRLSLADIGPHQDPR